MYNLRSELGGENDLDFRKVEKNDLMAKKVNSMLSICSFKI